MNTPRLKAVTERYSALRIAVVGDFCLDRYLEIDPAKQEVSIETGLPVHNVVRVRSQPGAAGTILNNLVALGVQQIYPVGFAGEDGEGFELVRSLAAKPGVLMEQFIQTDLRRTFTYCKPLLVEPGKPPVELNRLDSKNWTPTPPAVQQQIGAAITALVGKVDAMILLDQVDLAETGVVTQAVLQTIAAIAREHSDLLIIADSRRSLRDFPSVCFKMNRAEFQAMTGTAEVGDVSKLKNAALDLARDRGRHVFITLAEDGIIAASPAGECDHVPALPLRGEIDIVGAGDSVTANLTAGLAAGASLQEALELAMLASSLVIHQLGTTGTASVADIQHLHESVRTLPGSSAA